MDFSTLKTMTGQEIDPFLQAYRTSLEEQREASLKQLEQERQNQQQSIMSAANTRGMLYSNFPARQKIIYDTQTYYPSVQKVQSSYQSGLDTLRNNMVKYINNIEDLKQAINETNQS